MKRDLMFSAALPVPMASKLIHILMQDRPCWRVTRVLGSMLVFDFGDRKIVTNKRVGEIQVGSEQLSIRNVQWSARGPGLGRTTSDNLDASKMDQMCSIFSNAVLEGCYRKGGRLVLRFGEGRTLSLDLNNRYEVEDDEEIAEFRMTRGLSLSLSPAGIFALQRINQIVDSKVAA